ncbi:MAG: RnfABCDGE type electron transport complex subunit D, partial [Desulfobulbaceae bacterium]|nr:RnfABCDGE type electron transport complex subunit D [Desulfobulbaceae bacterium]
MLFRPPAIPDKWFLLQAPMLKVCYALLPLTMAAVALFGWRALALTLVVLFCGFVTEAFFTFPQGKPVTSAALVTGLIFSLSLPPSLPMWMAAVGIVFGVGFGKMAFGGFGRNVFNPAMVGRCFLYSAFPLFMTNFWNEPATVAAGGLRFWALSPDAITGATSLVNLTQGISPTLTDLFLGNTAGSLGETSALLILLAAGYLLYTKVASWRLLFSCLGGGILAILVTRELGVAVSAAPIAALLSGSFLFGTVFVVTEPISAAKTPAGQVVYGFFVGVLTIL